jgi:uncharacterized protein YeaO (DUF488 family)
MPAINIKRVYEPAAGADGYRVLVDRLWPRGLTKEKAAIDAWWKQLAPSSELRKWYGHDPAKWKAFRHRYQEELLMADATVFIRDELSKHKTITLLYASRESEINHAIVLRDFILSQSKRPR